LIQIDAVRWLDELIEKGLTYATFDLNDCIEPKQFHDTRATTIALMCLIGPSIGAASFRLRSKTPTKRTGRKLEALPTLD